jgi:(p)ppGpp synthase/HD superfamily hydrolase
MKSIIQQWKDAKTISVIAHEGQKDLAGGLYFGHVNRVANNFGRNDYGIVAYLHDVIEDANWTLDRLLEQGFCPKVVEAVEALTRRKGEEYMDYIDRCARNTIALHVKLADLTDNMDIRRLSEITDKDVARLRKYHKAYHYLKAKLVE